MDGVKTLEMYIYIPLSTYDPARGFSLGRHSGLLSVSDSELSARETLPFLDASASGSVVAALFFLPPSGEELLYSSSAFSTGEEWVSVPLGVAS